MWGGVDFVDVAKMEEYVHNQNGVCQRKRKASPVFSCLFSLYACAFCFLLLNCFETVGEGCSCIPKGTLCS